jgi:hypothetical protein
MRFPSKFNVIVPLSYSTGQIIRPMWLEEPEADAYLGAAYTLIVPGGTRCLWTRRDIAGQGNLEMIYPMGGPIEEYPFPLPETVRPVEME